MSPIVKILGSKGKLSNLLNKRFSKNKNLNLNQKVKDKISNIKVATFSSTLKDDCYENFIKEINYYEKLLKNLDSEKEFLIYISSQTVELTNNTFYSKAKFEVEKLIRSNLKNYTIIRPGMIFNKEDSKFLLNSMNNASRSFFTFFDDHPQITICDISDIYNLIVDISHKTSFYASKTINLGIKRFKFIELQNFSFKRKIRIPILNNKVLKLLSIFNIRLKAYCNGQAISGVPDIAWKSYFDYKS